MINHITLLDQVPLTYLPKTQQDLFKNAFLIAMLFFFSCASQITYEGERNQEGKYHGKGVITYSNGEKWENDKPENGYYAESDEEE